MLNQIFGAIESAGGQSLIVGGFVRDTIMGVQSKDIDIEVYGLSLNNLKNVLVQFGSVDLMGVQYGILKLKPSYHLADKAEKNIEYDFSIPRRESKVGTGHKGFDVEVDHTMSPEEAAQRRDFSINAIGMRPNGELVDFNNGIEDIKSKTLRPTSDKFSEDPLRILRGLQFAARFGFAAHPDLVKIKDKCIAESHTIASSRIWGEWEKWLLRGHYYSESLQYLCDVLGDVYPWIARLKNVPQDAYWHPEGDVLKHTGHCLDYITKRLLTTKKRIVIMLAVLCHDFGKLTHTTVGDDGKIRATGHEAASEQPTREFLASIHCPQEYIEKVVGLVVNHMANTEKPCATIVKKLAHRLSNYKTNIADLALVIEADRSGRPPRPQGIDERLEELLQLSATENCLYDKQPALVMGGQICDLGYSGEIVGKIYKRLYEMQMRGSFATAEQGLRRIKDFVTQL